MAFLLATVANALHFYLDAGETRCFIEELPTDTVVEGAYARSCPDLSYKFKVYKATIVHSPGTRRNNNIALMKNSVS